MLLNALVHRTYKGATIQMRVFDDKLSIWNEGGLTFGLSFPNTQTQIVLSKGIYILVIKSKEYQTKKIFKIIHQ